MLDSSVSPSRPGITDALHQTKEQTMSTNDRAAEAVTVKTKDAAASVTDDGDLKDEEITDQARIKMKANLEDAGYTVKDTVTE
jgi:hypothetical protein